MDGITGIWFAALVIRTEDLAFEQSLHPPSRDHDFSAPYRLVASNMVYAIKSGRKR